MMNDQAHLLSILDYQDLKNAAFASSSGTTNDGGKDLTIRISNPGEIGASRGEESQGLEELDGQNMDLPSAHPRDVSDGLAENVLSILGPAGPGLLAVRNVPGVAELRKRLLPMAQKLALMPDELRRDVLKVANDAFYENVSSLDRKLAIEKNAVSPPQFCRAAVASRSSQFRSSFSMELNLNTDVPLKKADRPVSAFATQLYYGHQDQPSRSCKGSRYTIETDPPQASNSIDSAVVSASSEENIERHELGEVVRQLGSVMIEVGLLIARLCDKASPGAEIENAILESGTAKGRLIHYHSLSERYFMLSQRMNNGTVKKTKNKVRKASPGGLQTREDDEDGGEIYGKGNQKTEPWQQWHFDYGLLTVLTSPLYSVWNSPVSKEGVDLDTTSCINEPSSWTHGADGEHSGLVFMHRGAARRVKIPADCLVVQVGEAAQILSGGRLVATAHCVSSPPDLAVNRATFVVFLQPAWQKRLSPPSWSSVLEVLHPRDEQLVVPEPCTCCNHQDDASHQGALISEYQPVVETAHLVNPEACRKFHELRNMLLSVPPLASRWHCGCTFAEFSKITTRQYYGADGRQSRR
ncbi:hypothetical protein R1sor_020344 [Riccia sorocarpa]|uniref:Isopenicillin N synthase-like Fe(2+) 2OG dioxygenase domain-containing protein n=1 Tax=Riccia sorocarpa TaxID=122646 RepID=A0ABD3IHX2_9MARC